MDTLKALIIILMSNVLVNNYVLSKFLGICPFLGVSKKLDSAVAALLSQGVTLEEILKRIGGNNHA